MATATGPTYKSTLSAEMQKRATEELKEKPEWINRDIQALRDMVLKHRGLTSRMEDEFLIRFLRAKKYDYERAYTQLVNYYTLREEAKDYIKELRPSAVKLAIESGVSQVLPHKDKLGRRIVYFRPGKWDPAVYSCFDILVVNLINMEIVIKEEDTQVNGIVMIGNMVDVGWSQAKALDRQYFKLMTNLLQESFPGRFKGMHAINEPAVFGYVFALVKPFLKEKFTSRMSFHGSSLESLHQQFDPAILPEELDGALPHGDKLARIWKEKVFSEEDNFAAWTKYKIELPKKIMAHEKESVDCLAGTYKKLNVD